MSLFVCAFNIIVVLFYPVLSSYIGVGGFRGSHRGSDSLHSNSQTKHYWTVLLDLYSGLTTPPPDIKKRFILTVVESILSSPRVSVTSQGTPL